MRTFARRMRGLGHRVMGSFISTAPTLRAIFSCKRRRKSLKTKSAWQDAVFISLPFEVLAEIRMCNCDKRLGPFRH